MKHHPRVSQWHNIPSVLSWGHCSSTGSLPCRLPPWSVFPGFSSSRGCPGLPGILACADLPRLAPDLAVLTRCPFLGHSPHGWSHCVCPNIFIPTEAFSSCCPCLREQHPSWAWSSSAGAPQPPPPRKLRAGTSRLRSQTPSPVLEKSFRSQHSILRRPSDQQK